MTPLFQYRRMNTAYMETPLSPSLISLPGTNSSESMQPMLHYIRLGMEDIASIDPCIAQRK